MSTGGAWNDWRRTRAALGPTLLDLVVLVVIIIAVVAALLAVFIGVIVCVAGRIVAIVSVVGFVLLAA